MNRLALFFCVLAAMPRGKVRGEIDAQFGNDPILIADKRDGKPRAANRDPFWLICPHDKECPRSIGLRCYNLRRAMLTSVQSSITSTNF